MIFSKSLPGKVLILFVPISDRIEYVGNVQERLELFLKTYFMFRQCVYNAQCWSRKMTILVNLLVRKKKSKPILSAATLSVWFWISGSSLMLKTSFSAMNCFLQAKLLTLTPFFLQNGSCLAFYHNSELKSELYLLLLFLT